MNQADRIQFRISLALKFLVVAVAGLNLLNQDYFFFGASLFVLFLMFLPAILRKSMRLTLPPEIDLIITVFLCLHYVLGEYGGFYSSFFWWDIFLHGLGSIILGLAGFLFAYSLLLTSRISAKPLFIFFFSVTSAVFLGVLWEIFEFLTDHFLGFNMQKSGLMDTMTDLIVDVFGAIMAGAVGFFYMKRPDPKVIKAFLRRLSKFSNRIT